MIYSQQLLFYSLGNSLVTVEDSINCQFQLLGCAQHLLGDSLPSAQCPSSIVELGLDLTRPRLFVMTLYGCQQSST